MVIRAQQVDSSFPVTQTLNLVILCNSSVDAWRNFDIFSNIFCLNVLGAIIAIVISLRSP